MGYVSFREGSSLFTQPVILRKSMQPKIDLPHWPQYAWQHWHPFPAFSSLPCNLGGFVDSLGKFVRLEKYIYVYIYMYMYMYMYI